MPVIRLGDGNVVAQLLFLGMTLVGLGLAFDFLYAELGAVLARWITRRPAIHVVQRWTFATLLVLFGVRLALANRPLV